MLRALCLSLVLAATTVRRAAVVTAFAPPPGASFLPALRKQQQHHHHHHHHHRRASRGAVRANLLDDASSLPPQAVLQSVSGGGRFTAADVSAKAGTDLEASRRALTSLAALLGDDATLEVSGDGEIVYQLPPDAEGKIAAKSRLAAARKQLEAAKPALFTAARVAFGVGLLASIAAVYSAVIFISASGSSSSDDRRDDRRGGGGGFVGMPNLYYGPNIFDVFYYRPYYYYGGPRYYSDEPPEMGLLESVYSYVFGDGDPNADRDARVVKAAAKAIRESGGAVTAEQLMPFVPEPSDTARLSGSAAASSAASSSSGSYVVDESCVLPIVERLQGTAQVTEDGQIVYTFDDVAVTAAVDDVVQAEFNLMDEQQRGGGGGGAARDASAAFRQEFLEDEDEQEDGGNYLQERPVKFSAASGFNLFVAGALGALNLVGALWLGLQLASLPPGAVLPGGYGTIQALYPLLLAYAVAFNAAPLLRSARVGAANAAIEERNQARRMAAVAVEAAPKAAFAAARKMGAGVRRVLSRDSVYSSKEGEAQESAGRNALEDFDKRLKDFNQKNE